VLRGERELSKILTDELGFEVKRKLGQARDGGDDIQIGKYRIEVKRREALRLDDWCQQIEKVCDPRGASSGVQKEWAALESCCAHGLAHQADQGRH
jgi:hypothetical protein